MIRPLVLVALTALITLTSHAGDSHSRNCQPVRTANVTVEVNRLHWLQNQGSYELKRETVCTVRGTVHVLPDLTQGCANRVYPTLATCQIELDGKAHTLKVSGEVFHNSEPASQTKHFIAGYHLDRNNGNITTGEAARADIYTADLGLKNIGLRLQSKLDSPIPGIKIRDGVSVTVDFEDAHAP